MSVTPAGAAVAAVHPDTLTVCYTGTNNTYEYYVWCNGTGPTSYRSIVYCADGQVVFGVERWDGDDRESYASCESNGLGSTLSDNWGIPLCSNDNGTGTYEGYDNRHGDILRSSQGSVRIKSLGIQKLLIFERTLGGLFRPSCRNADQLPLRWSWRTCRSAAGSRCA